MAESVNSKLTNIADAIRTLSDTTDKLSLAEMAAEIDAANAELAEQLTLIEEIAALVETKSLPDEEVERQAELIEQLKVAVEALPEAGQNAQLYTMTIRYDESCLQYSDFADTVGNELIVMYSDGTEIPQAQVYILETNHDFTFNVLRNSLVLVLEPFVVYNGELEHTHQAIFEIGNYSGVQCYFVTEEITNDVVQYISTEE